MRYRVTVLRSTVYEVQADCADEAFDLVFGEHQDDYEVDGDTLDHQIEELDEASPVSA